MSGDRIGVLLAGFGGIGTQDHQNAMYLPAFRTRSDFAIVGVCDVPGADGARKAAHQHDLRYFDDLDVALADPSVSVVSVAAPLEHRAGVVTRAVRAGKHVLADKPLAATLAEVDQVSQAAADAGVVVVPAHHQRFQRALRATRAAVRAGRVGLPWNVQADFLVAGGDPAPAGELVNFALYPVDVIHSFLGLAVRRVHAIGASHWHQSPNDLVTLMLDHEHGVTSTVVCGRMTGLRDLAPGALAVHRYRISGSHGVLAVDAARPALNVRTASTATTAWTGPGTLDALLDALAAGVRTGRTELGPADARHAQLVVDAARRSIDSGRPVDLEGGE
jgi:predicted dehydrogenase